MFKFVKNIARVLTLFAGVSTAQADEPIEYISSNPSIQGACSAAFNTPIQTIDVGNVSLQIGHNSTAPKGEGLILEMPTKIEKSNQNLINIKTFLSGAAPKKLIIKVNNSTGGNYQLTQDYYDTVTSNSEHSVITISNGVVGSGLQ